MSLPTTRQQLCDRMDLGETFDLLLFYGHKPPKSGVDKSCFSQWFVREFSVDSISYPTAEHWMMAEKARLFGDTEMLNNILNSASPRDAKAFGRQVRDFDSDVWDKHKFEIVVRGNEEKFSQHKDMADFLVATGNTNSLAGDIFTAYREQDLSLVAEPRVDYKVHGAGSESRVILVEAAGRDCVWGIGYGEKNPKAIQPLQWRGQNLLGFALTVVREQLADDLNRT